MKKEQNEFTPEVLEGVKCTQDKDVSGEKSIRKMNQRKEKNLGKIRCMCSAGEEMCWTPCVAGRGVELPGWTAGGVPHFGPHLKGAIQPGQLGQTSCFT